VIRGYLSITGVFQKLSSVVHTASEMHSFCATNWSIIIRLGKIRVKPRTLILFMACRCTTIQFVQALGIHLKPMNSRLDLAVKHCPEKADRVLNAP
jgi:hypothetical protein